MGALEYATSPHSRSPVSAKSFRIMKRDMARGWITGQIKQNVMDEILTQAPNLSKIADIFARTTEFMGKCRFPLYLSKTKAEERFLIWGMLNERRMERNGWPFVGPEEEQTSLHSTIASRRRIAERNRSQAHLRYLRARRMASSDNNKVWGEDSFLGEPSADESLPPDHSDFPLTLSSALSLPLASPDPRLTFSSLNRSDDTLESGSAKERKKMKGRRASAAMWSPRETPRTP